MTVVIDDSAMKLTHLDRRDRLARRHRVIGAAAGFLLIGIAFATSSWNSPWFMILFGIYIVGGVLSYYLLTSIVQCPSCHGRVSNFRIASAEADRKIFACRNCGSTSWLAEGFYWQSETSG